jgi:hypothetical protein
MCSTIPASPAYGVYISQLIRYARASSNYSDFLKRHPPIGAWSSLKLWVRILLRRCVLNTTLCDKVSDLPQFWFSPALWFPPPIKLPRYIVRSDVQHHYPNTTLRCTLLSLFFIDWLSYCLTPSDQYFSYIHTKNTFGYIGKTLSLRLTYDSYKYI